MKRAILLIPFAIATGINAQAQSIGPSTVNSAGHTATIMGNEFDWSVGEMALVSTFSTASIIVTQGVLQPDDNLPSAVANTSPLTNQLQIFPNPATSVVNIKFSAQSQGTLSYKLLDMEGKVVRKQIVDVTQGTNTEKVDVTNLACATYMLDITVNAANTAPQSISYKIQKLK